MKYNQIAKAQWKITPGVAKEYALRFRYKNVTGAPVKARLRVIDSKHVVMRDAEITFPPTPKKFKTVSTTTATQINAGVYQVILSNAGKLDFETLEVQ